MSLWLRSKTDPNYEQGIVSGLRNFSVYTNNGKKAQATLANLKSRKITYQQAKQVLEELRLKNAREKAEHKIFMLFANGRSKSNMNSASKIPYNFFNKKIKSAPNKNSIEKIVSEAEQTKKKFKEMSNYVTKYLPTYTARNAANENAYQANIKQLISNLHQLQNTNQLNGMLQRLSNLKARGQQIRRFGNNPYG